MAFPQALLDRCRALRAGGWLPMILALLWAAELSALQHWTTFPDADLSILHAIKDAARRFVLNFTGCAALVCLFRGWPLILVFGVGFAASNLLVVYADYFGQPLSWPVIARQWREGLAVSDHGMALVNWKTLALAGVALGGKIWLAHRCPRRETASAQRMKWAAAFASAYLCIAVGLAGFSKPIKRINIGTPQYIYGYTVAWAAEMWSLDDEKLLQEAVDKARRSSDVLAGIEQPVSLGRHVAIVQVESLDFDAIHADHDTEPVMPFLRQLTSQSMVYAVKPFHSAGSSEADFSMLTSSTPIGRMNPFQVKGFPYENALPWLARQRGYKAIALHGNTGAFFHRRQAYEQMGFEKLYFTEELKPHGVRGELDEELLMFSAKLLAEAATPCLHFVITITSHGPFNRLGPKQCELFPAATTLQQRYLNSMRYVDRALEKYVASIPDDTLVVIYGDHESRVYGYSGQGGRTDRVPWFIFRKGSDLSGLQHSAESGLALSGNLTQLDLACFFRDQLAAARPAETFARPRERLADAPGDTTVE